MRVHRSAAFVVALLVLALGTLLGQGTTSIRGIILDPSGAAVAGAAVELLQPEAGLAFAATSDEFGNYEFPQIPPGQYQISATAKNFVAIRISDVVLSVGQPATLPIAFTSISQLGEVIEIHASSNPLNTTDASLGHPIDERAIEELPFNARNVVNMLSLQPGVTFIGDTDTLREDRRAGNVNGSRADQANVTLDGVDVNDQQNRIAFTSVLRSTLDSVPRTVSSTTNPE